MFKLYIKLYRVIKMMNKKAEGIFILNNGNEFVKKIYGRKF